MEASSVTNALFSNLNYRAENQKVISSNIANINTPNYKTKELNKEHNVDSFETTLQMVQTDSKHISNTNNISNKLEDKKFYLEETNGLTEQNDGNNVNLDQQMSLQSQNSVIFNAIQGAIKKDSRLMREVIASSGKS